MSKYDVKVGQVYRSKKTGKYTVVVSTTEPGSDPIQGVALRYLKSASQPGSGKEIGAYAFRPNRGDSWELMSEPVEPAIAIEGYWYVLDTGGIAKAPLGVHERAVAVICNNTFDPVMGPTPESEPELEPDAVVVPPAPEPVKSKDEKLQGALEVLGELLNEGKGSDVSESKVLEIVDRRFKELDRPTRVTVKVGDKDFTPVEGLVHKDFDTILKAVAAGIRPMLVGPAGSGKTTIAEQVAAALGIKAYHTGAVKSEYKLVGYKDANGHYHTTPFREAFEKGGLFLFDEIDSSHPEAVVAFNAALANGRHDFPDGIVTAHKDFKVMAAANTFGRGADRQYVGRNQLDAASLDRFMVIAMDYDEQLERALVPTEQLAWVEYVQAVRKAVAKAKVRHVVSPRASLDGAKLLAAGLDRDMVVEGVIWKGLDDVNRKKVKAEMRG